MPVETAEVAKDFIKRWMQDRKVFTEEKTSEATLFHYIGTWVTGVNFSIQQPKNIPRAVGVTTRLLIASSHLEVLKNLSPQKNEEFFKRLTEKFLFISPTFNYGPTPEDKQWILFVKEITYDELTEGRLLDAVDQISRAAIWGSLVIIDILGEPKGET